MRLAGRSSRFRASSFTTTGIGSNHTETETSETKDAHQLDVCRWFTGDPILPVSTVSVGARLGYDDDGNWANTQVCYYDYPIPIIFEVRGLPTDGYKGQSIGNIIECEGGHLAGGHGPNCTAFDKDGKKLKTFQGAKNHMQSFVDSCHEGKIEYSHGAESSHLSSALAHIGNISWKLGAPTKPADIKAAIKNATTNEAVVRMIAHLENNEVNLDKNMLALGKHLTLDPEKEIFTGEFAEEANPLLKGTYREGFEIVT